LGVVSPGYELVTNEEVFDLFSKATEGLSVAKINDHLDADTKRWKRHMIFDDDRLNHEITTGDFTGVLLEVSNGFTGKIGFGFSLMGYRWLCENGMVMGKKELFSGSFAHFVNNPERLRESFEMKFDAFTNNAENWKKWTEMPFSTKMFETFVLDRTRTSKEEPSKTKYLTTKVSKNIVDSYPLLLNEGGLDETKWGAFNVLTNLATHHTKARNGSNVFSRRYNTINRLAADLYEYQEAA